MDSIATDSRSRWSARLDVQVERSGGDSFLGTRRHSGPLRIQRPFYPEGRDLPHIYLLHPPGGLVGGDRLETHVSIAEGASALFTTPAAQKLYRSSALPSEQVTELTLCAAASMEWFPGETIAFDGAIARARTRVTLEAGAAFLGWEILCFGRTASALPFERGELGLAFELSRQGTPLVIDRVCVRGGSPVLSAPWGYRSQPVFATLYCVPREPGSLGELELALSAASGSIESGFAVTRLDGALIVRAAAGSVEAARRALERCWQFLRPAVLGRPAVAPRIWAV